MHGVIETAHPLLDRLRSDTATRHEALEAGLALLEPPLSPDRFRRVLEGFYGFHVVWEPAAATRFADFLLPRRRLACLNRDLTALGLSETVIDALPRCKAAADLARDPASVLGAAYVLEGSSLGGKVITRALAGQAWLPSGGFSYFDPYGDQTGVRWRETRAFIEREGARSTDAVVAAAGETFDLLTAWLTGDRA
ncbi:biliverdin-producing heme oxygenase [Caulobacter sp. NIBR2454]|uniref:biliverdin-producing heme oxygenase n=1 Tax=Caulobacter sp. NIBR2454 TaxID=3015996 RepID=UPI0022B5F2EC|nr:biliverdin-producing heme oxygenase [Caulobacter sp. NIBR2454]